MEHNLLTLVFNECARINDMFVDVEKSWSKEEYIYKGFKIYSESKDYWYLERKIDRDELFNI